VHRPLSDTWLLASAMATLGVRGAAVADLCTGSGALAIAASEAGAGLVVAVDVSRRAVLNARVNAHANGCRVRVRRGDLLGGLGRQRFDLIVSNPPYVPSETDRLPRHTRRAALDGGRDGRILIDSICAGAPRHLLPGGSVLIVHSSICDVQATRDLLAAHGLRPSIAASSHGPLGPVMRARSGLLHGRGLLRPGDGEELVVIRGQAPDGQHRAEE
jgi:release factor glutamine methyltransferase